MARGSPDGRKIKVAVGFEPTLFTAIDTEAGLAGKSFASMVRELCQRALIPQPTGGQERGLSGDGK